ncbi:transglutaminase TgpA family protein [Methylobacter sp. sgz302048]|uniref:transglutaminase TgpA family protein n=1 Tax=Methylobacter sp. sgz302048 TaxID=3455945 RepID=UPI003F9FEBBC
MPGSTGAVLNIMRSKFNKSVLIFLLSSIGLIVFPHVYHLPAAVLSFFFLILGWRFAGIWKPGWLPNSWFVLLLTLLGVGLLYSQHHSLLGRDPGTGLFVIGLALKLLEIKTERDIYLITYLAFIVAASQFLYEQNILVGVYIVAVCCVLFATLVSINSLRPRTLPALKAAAVIMAQALPIAGVLFILFPRIEAPRLLLLNEDHQTKSGLSDSIEPGSISNLGLSDELVFRVKFKGALPPPAQRYWRGPVMTHTDGRLWTQSVHKDFKRFLDKPKFTGAAYQYTLLMEPQDKPWVFALDIAAEYQSPASLNANYQLVSEEALGKRAEYKVTSYTQYNTGYITKTEYQDATQLPDEPSERINQLVRQLHGFDSPPETYIQQLLNHFKKEDFHYTLTPPLMEENPIETFLFETRYGFCSHYAAAFVYLIRIADIPARIVTGYQGGELNKIGNFLEIRQAHAHAWTEVWLQDKGWVRIDPTAAIAPERIEQDVNVDQQVASGIVTFVSPNSQKLVAFDWLKQTHQLWNSADYSWQRWVINYNSMSQLQLLSWWGIQNAKTMLYSMLGLIALMTAVLGWFLLHRKPKKTDSALRLYNRFCKKLVHQGFIRSESEGARDFAERVKSKLPEKSAQIDQITDVFIKLRYGQGSGPEDLKRLHKLVMQFKAAD